MHAAVTTLSLGQLSQFTAATASASMQLTLVLVNFHRKLNRLTTPIYFTAIYLVQSVSAPPQASTLAQQQQQQPRSKSWLHVTTACCTPGAR